MSPKACCCLDDVHQSLQAFKDLPGQTAYCLQISDDDQPPLFEAEENGDQSLFCGSAFKVFVVAAYLREAEAGRLDSMVDKRQSALQAALAESLSIDVSVHAPSSRVFDDLSGTTMAIAVLEAMIAYSDNTATDVAMKRLGVETVREFLYTTAGLSPSQVRIPDSIRAFAKYLDASSEYGPLNAEQTIICPAKAFVSFYRRALQGEFFQNTGNETLRQFKRILSTADAIPIAVPEDTICYMKGGSVSWNNSNRKDAKTEYVAYHDFYCMAGAGQMLVAAPSQGQLLRVTFALLYNWRHTDFPSVALDHVEATGTEKFIAKFRNVLSTISDAIQAGEWKSA